MKKQPLNDVWDPRCWVGGALGRVLSFGLRNAGPVGVLLSTLSPEPQSHLRSFQKIPDTQTAFMILLGVAQLILSLSISVLNAISLVSDMSSPRILRFCYPVYPFCYIWKSDLFAFLSWLQLNGQLKRYSSPSHLLFSFSRCYDCALNSCSFGACP